MNEILDFEEALNKKRREEEFQRRKNDLIENNPMMAFHYQRSAKGFHSLYDDIDAEAAGEVDNFFEDKSHWYDEKDPVQQLRAKIYQEKIRQEIDPSFRIDNAPEQYGKELKLLSFDQNFINCTQTVMTSRIPDEQKQIMKLNKRLSALQTRESSEKECID